MRKPNFAHCAIILAVLALFSISLSLTSGAASATTSSRMSRHQAQTACQSTRVVSHQEAVSHHGPDVDSPAWIQKVANSGNQWIELDGQPSADGTEFLYHDETLSRGSNGTGVLHYRHDKYLHGVRTIHGNRLGTLWSLMQIMHQTPGFHAQHEFKDYRGQWTKAALQRWHDTLVKAGLDKRFDASSAWPVVLERLEKIDPSIYTEFIGFGNNHPSLKLAKQYHFDQVNVSYVAAFKPWGKFSTYIAAAHAKGIAVSIRSMPSGQGDTPYWWGREIRAGAAGLVVQNLTKHYVCSHLR